MELNLRILLSAIAALKGAEGDSTLSYEQRHDIKECWKEICMFATRIESICLQEW